MERMLASNKHYKQCKINGLENHFSFYTFCLLIVSFSFSFYLDSQDPSSHRLSPRPRFARHHVIAPSSPHLCDIVVFYNVLLCDINQPVGCHPLFLPFSFSLLGTGHAVPSHGLCHRMGQ